MFVCRACFTRAFTTLRTHKSATTLQPIFNSILSRRQRYATAPISVESPKQPPKRRPDRPSQRLRKWAATKQLQYLKDPLHIAEYVKKTLDKDNYDEAALIVRKASKDTKVSVSWNHLIDYLLKKGRLHAALKLFNEMKKRAQLPNAQTYTIIFRGCANSPHPKLALAESMRLYQNMLSSGRIKPNVIHLNAVLQVCAKVRDIDSLFTIVRTANEGMRAPNNLTYTTVLNALRRSTEDKYEHVSADEINTGEIKKEVARTIELAKGVWEDVVSKWRAGSVVIDEELVCAMGRVLLMGNYHDVDSIEALVEQTMMISREKPTTSEDAKGVDDPAETGADPKLVTTASRHNKSKAPGLPSITHAPPGNNSLSMLLSAFEKTGKTSRAERYWGIFTKRYGVVPDAENWHRLFAVFRRGKNSANALSAVRNMPGELMVPKNFRSAMSTCLRDNLNRSSFNHATQILEIMLEKLRIPDLITLRTYLRVAYANRRLFIEQSKGNYDEAMRAYGKQLAAALDNLWKPYRIAAKHCVYNKTGPHSKAEVVALARKMITTYDRLIFNDMVPPAVAEKMKPTRNNLNRFVVAHFEELKKEASNPNEGKEEKEANEEDGDDEDEGNDFFEQMRQRRVPVGKRTTTEGW
ncbi:hypothetical protein F4779DRAFT_578230 [Xylariaceae sp. FL0662B]|nr:hypothetical protein F4779DRAFT_578230 [Xylariaceae sp. FL0662B]